MSYLAENIRFLRKQKDWTQAELASKLGVNRSLIGAYEEGRSEPRLKTLEILCLMFKLDLRKLVQTKIQSPGANQTLEKDITGERLRILPVVVNSKGEEQIPLLPQKAAAGYTKGYGDMEFIEKLQTTQLPFPELSRNRTHRIFQVEGDSMLPVQSGSYIITEYVEDWNTMKNNECYILLTKDEGIVYKRVLNQLHEKEGFTLKSDNTLFAPYFISVDDVMEVWRARGVISFSIPDSSVYAEQLNQKVMESIYELKDEIKSLSKNIDDLRS